MGTPDNFTEENIKDLFQLKAQSLKKKNDLASQAPFADDVQTATNQRIALLETQFNSLMSLLGGFEGLSKTLSEIAIMKKK